MSLRKHLFLTLMLYGVILISLMSMEAGCTSSGGTQGSVPLETPTLSVTPGLIVYGYVRDASGAGLANVGIYRNYASYPAELIATTDAEGYYESDFYPVPGDEMVSVYAQYAGVEFEPEYVRWRHYYGYEKTECDFSARSATPGTTNK
ncbi:MAG TPA: hypothetical protein VF831_06965 [Anaerolineales bacterium]